MANVYITVWDGANEVALGDPIQYATAIIDGANSDPITNSGSGKVKRRCRCRLYAESNAWVKFGDSPTATGASDSIALGADNPEYFDIEAGYIITAIMR